MAKKIHEEELNAIVHVIAGFPDGVSSKEILKLLKSPLSSRNLHHRLKILIKSGSIIPRGNSRARVYIVSSSKTNRVLKNNHSIPLCEESKKIENLLNQSRQNRIPVGYQWEFLNRYRPNESCYLPKEVVEELSNLGKTDGERPAGTYARQVLSRLLIDLSWNSSRLEGNTYSLLETERLINLSEAAEGKDYKEARMILNHKEAIEFLVDSASEVGIDRFTILNLHGLLSNELLGDFEASGRLRKIPIGIGSSVYHPIAIPQLIEEYFQQIIDTANAIKEPFEQSFFLMVHLPYLQPFEDVNKRVSRLAANIPFIKNNLAPLSFVDLPQEIYVRGLLAVYELNRIELLRDVFIWAYKRSCLFYSISKKQIGEPDSFRMKYRKLIYEIVPEIVKERLNKPEAIKRIQDFSNSHVPTEDQFQFIENVEKDLMSLHEGNIARHRLRLAEYKEWKQVWD